MFRFTERKEDEGSEAKQTPEKPEENDSDEEEQLDEAEEAAEAKELEAHLYNDNEEPPKKKPKMVTELQNYNTPTKTSVVTEEFKVGNRAVIRQDKNVRIGEIIEVWDDTIKLQWYGSTTAKSLARHRWKFYKGWETREGEIEYRRT